MLEHPLLSILVYQITLSQSVGCFHFHFITKDSTESQIIQNNADCRQTQCPSQLKAVSTQFALQHVPEHSCDNVITDQQQTVEYGHTYLQHAITEQENSSQCYNGTQQQNTEHTPCRLKTSVSQSHSQRLEYRCVHSICCNERTYRLTHGDNQ